MVTDINEWAYISQQWDALSQVSFADLIKAPAITVGQPVLQCDNE